MERKLALRRLLSLLQLAYSGELAAGFAYRGHWRSVREESSRNRIRQIEEEEWHHRRQVGRMIAALGGKPSKYREARAWLIGRALGLGCHVAGHFLPLYGAGKLESRNVKEYEDAARYARDAGHPQFIDCLLQMAEVEWEHERYFRSQVEGHGWLRWFRLWPPLPPKELIRGSF